MTKRLPSAVLRSSLYKAYDRAFRKFNPASIDFFINEYSKSHPNVFFIQVGANDGITWDPFHYFIRRDHWKGLVIEPQHALFEQRLRQTYADVPGITLLNTAVDVADGSRPLYRFGFSSSRWATGLASFDKQMLIANFNSDYVQENIKKENLSVSSDPAEYLTVDVVPCTSFETIIRSLGRETIDFVMTDVEGHDVAILNSFPFHRIQPANVVFELPLRLDDSFIRLVNTLKAYDYDIFVARRDAIAMRKDAGRV